MTDVATEEAAAHGEGLVFHPLDQFKITRLFGEGPIEWYTPTNATLWMALAIVAILVIFVFGSKGRALIPSRLQSIGEMAYGFVYKMVEDVAGHDGAKFFPMIMTLFIFILTANMLGLIPGSFTPTSHIAVTAVLGFGFFIFVTLLGFAKNGAHFLGLFWMSDAPLILRPIIAIIEVIATPTPQANARLRNSEKSIIGCAERAWRRANSQRKNTPAAAALKITVHDELIWLSSFSA